MSATCSEWLGAMVVSQVIEQDPEAETYRLPPEHAAFLTRAAAPNNLAVIAQFVPVLVARSPVRRVSVSISASKFAGHREERNPVDDNILRLPNRLVSFGYVYIPTAAGCFAFRAPSGEPPSRPGITIFLV
jgi:hypothetical protein